ncbi:NnrS multi-domain protein [Streptomyces sp. NPDC095613]|uniref:NnrS multi-domain protein n=1 Tax=Streptomyces sp. NPDC095613 TaxID=3155540 RepID=UPI00332F3EE2
MAGRIARARYDQRVLALVEVRGGDRDWAEAEQVFEAHGWLVLDHSPPGGASGPGAALRPDPAARLYRIEVRLYGSARRAERGAAWHVRRAARAAQLEMYVRRADRLERDVDLLPEWLAHSAPRRTARPPGSPARGPLVTRVRRRLGRWAARTGAYDAGTMVSGAPLEALRLARADLPGGAAARGDVSVRPMDGRRRRPASSRRPEGQLDRRLARLALSFFVMAMAAVIAVHSTGAARYGWAGVALIALGIGTWAGLTMDRVGERATNLLLTVFVGVVSLSISFSDGGLSASQAATNLYGLVLAAGLWLLVRQWSWGEWATWVVPLVVTLVFSSFVGAGSVLHALYADALSLSPGDLDVPPIWQFASALRLVSFLLPVLLLPAVWGIAKHFHYVKPDERMNGLMYLALLAVFLVTAGGIAVDDATGAARRTAKAARKGDPAPPYFGVEPEWACLEPTVPLASLPGEGGRLDPTRPYLSFGVAGGDAVLRDRESGDTLKVPAGKVRIVPVDTGRGRCAGGGPTADTGSGPTAGTGADRTADSAGSGVSPAPPSATGRPAAAR